MTAISLWKSKKTWLLRIVVFAGALVVLAKIAWVLWIFPYPESSVRWMPEFACQGEIIAMNQQASRLDFEYTNMLIQKGTYYYAQFFNQRHTIRTAVRVSLNHPGRGIHVIIKKIASNHDQTHTQIWSRYFDRKPPHIIMKKFFHRMGPYQVYFASICHPLWRAFP